MRTGAVLTTISLAVAIPGGGAAAQQSANATTISVAARAGSFQVVRLPLPAALANAGETSVSIRGMNGFGVLGDTARVMRPGAADVLLTLAVPARALAGSATAAAVRFRDADGRTALVNVTAVVAAHHRIFIAADERRIGVFRGDAVSFRYRVANQGNATDSIQLEELLPPGWRGGGREMLVLAPGESRERSARARVSDGAATGSSIVRLLAIAGTDTIGDATATIEVGDRTRRASNAGARVTFTSAAAGSATELGGTAQTLNIDGPLTDHIRINARAAVLPGASEAGGQPFALTRMGYSPFTPTVMLTGDAWRLQVGSANVGLPDLTGYMVAGTGAAYEHDGDTWRVTTVAARPDRTASRAPGEFLAGSVGRRLSPDAAFTVTASHLQDERFTDSRLDALGGELRFPVLLGTTMATEVAERRFGTGAGIGWKTELRRASPTGTMLVHVASAPGGTAAFARAKHEVSAQVSQFFGPSFSVAGSFWRTRDSSASWRELAVNGWSLRPSLRLGRAVNFSVEARESDFTASGSAGALGTSEAALSGTLDARWGSFYGTGGLTTASVRRDAGVGDVRMDHRVERGTAQAAVGLASVFGRVELNVAGDRAGAGAGLPVRQVAYGLELAEARLIPWSRAITVSGGVQRFDWFGDRPVLYTLHGRADVNIARAVRVSFQAERNPFLSAITSNSGWLFGVAVQTALSLPRHSAAGDHGIIYRDLNADGMRGPGEPGVAGVVVRRESETAITRTDGTFEFANATALAIDVDTRSLPAGLIPPPTTAHGRGHDVGLLFVTTAQVDLAVAGDDGGRVTPGELAKVEVVARDARGRSWVAHNVSPARRLFDALPPGRYVIEIDASGSAEPLHVSGELPVVTVVDGVVPPASTVVLRARTLKVNRIPKNRL